MKKIILLSVVICLAGLGLVACEGTANNSSYSGANVNNNGPSVNTALNSAGNAVKTVANTISNLAGGTTSSASSFVNDAAQGGMAEVELGKLAASKGQNAEVKKFGQMMMVDHGKANAELKALAAKKQMTLPADIGSHKSTMDDLSKKTGADFDKAYVDAMVDDHETDVSAFQKQADGAADADIKAFAAKTLPVLKKHLEAIKAIQAKMK